MIYYVVCVKDTAVGCFNRPFFCRSTGEAMRIFTDEVNRNDRENPLFAHPKDFELWHIGLFDDATANFTTPTAPHVLAIAVDVRLTTE